MFWWLMTKIFFDRELVEWPLICSDLYQHRWVGVHMSLLTAENSHFLWSGSQEATLVMQCGVHFNVKKCNMMTISHRKLLDKFYQLNNTILDGVSSCTYLGVIISNTQTWSEQISTCAKKTNSSLGFLCQNLKGLPQQLRWTGYISLVWSLKEGHQPTNLMSSKEGMQLARSRTTMDGVLVSQIDQSSSNLKAWNAENRWKN